MENNKSIKLTKEYIYYKDNLLAGFAYPDIEHFENRIKESIKDNKISESCGKKLIEKKLKLENELSKINTESKIDKISEFYKTQKDQILNIIKTLKLDKKVERLKKECVELTFSEEKPTVFNSKIGGVPYLPLNMEYPKSKFDNLPLRFLAQINFEEIPHLKNFPTTGILQFFLKNNHTLGSNLGYGSAGREKHDIEVIYHENIIKDENLLYKDLSNLKIDELYEEDEDFFAFEKDYESKIIAKSNISYINSTCTSHLYDIKKLIYEYFEENEDNIESLVTEFDVFEYLECNYLKYEPFNLQIGGYPTLLHYDDVNSLNRTLLFQLQSTKDIIFGDDGVLNFFIKPKYLKTLNFSKVVFKFATC